MNECLCTHAHVLRTWISNSWTLCLPYMSIKQMYVWMYTFTYIRMYMSTWKYADMNMYTSKHTPNPKNTKKIYTYIHLDARTERQIRRKTLSFFLSFFLAKHRHTHVHIDIYVNMCICIRSYTRHTHVHIDIYVNMCICIRSYTSICSYSYRFHVYKSAAYFFACLFCKKLHIWGAYNLACKRCQPMCIYVYNIHM